MSRRWQVRVGSPLWWLGAVAWATLLALGILLALAAGPHVGT